MLKGINPHISPELLYVMAQMGHGDDLAIVDANFPAHALARHLPHGRVLTMGARLAATTRAVLTLFPLDDFVPAAATSMQVVGDPDAVPDPIREIIPLVEAAGSGLQSIDRFGFYELTRNSFAVLQTVDTRLYSNLILKKGVISPARGAIPG
ncbi:MAG: RbsD/FucU domain-containing protein [Paracoccus sp. (in: a-proteobacteria)]|uniref:RbsD/FucU family protein n=1 Tax=Paracoccus sp. TaxID=267 RepID=UPI0039E2DFE0